MANFSPAVANFSPGAMFKIGGGGGGWICRKAFYMLFSCTTKEVRMLKFIFQPGLKFKCDYMRFFSPFDRAETLFV